MNVINCETHFGDYFQSRSGFVKARPRNGDRLHEDAPARVVSCEGYRETWPIFQMKDAFVKGAR